MLFGAQMEIEIRPHVRERSDKMLHHCLNLLVKLIKMKIAYSVQKHVILFLFKNDLLEKSCQLPLFCVYLLV